MKNKRAVNAWGCLRGIAGRAEQHFEEDESEEKIIDFVCQNCGCTHGELEEITARVWKTITNMRNYKDSCSFSSDNSVRAK